MIFVPLFMVLLWVFCFFFNNSRPKFNACSELLITFFKIML